MIICTVFCRASLDKVFFPSVTLCNINQGRRSFFMSKGLHHDTKTLGLVLRTAYFGVRDDDNSTENIAKSSTLKAKPHIKPSGNADNQENLSTLKRIFSSDDVLKKV